MMRKQKKKKKLLPMGQKTPINLSEERIPSGIESYEINVPAARFTCQNIEKFDELIKPNFGKYRTIGCLRKTGEETAGAHVGDGIIEQYHFSGTFFWFSCNVFERPWFDGNRKSPHVIERWPGLIANLEESLSVFDVEDSPYYYHDEFWQAHNIKGDM